MRSAKFLLIIVLIIATCCENKSVKLPTLGITGIQDPIYDNSKVWMFFKVVEMIPLQNSIKIIR